MKEALFLADPDIRINQEIALGLAGELQKRGAWNVHLQSGFTPLPDLRKVLKNLKPDAIVVRQVELSPDEMEVLCRRPVPIVRVAVDWLPELPLPVVIPDEAAIGRMAAEYLLALRFDHFGVVAYREPHQALRCDVFCEEIGRRAGKTLDRFGLILRWPVDHTSAPYRNPEELARWLRRLPKPCAVYAHSDKPAAHLIRTCNEHGIRVPEDVAVLGVDDDPLFCHTVSPNLASIHVPNRRIGMEAGRLILDWQPGRRVLRVPPTTVMERGSVRPQTHADPLVNKALEYLRASVSKGVRVRDLQKLTGLSPQMLVYRFRAATRRTPMEEILRHRIAHAKYLLGETNEPVAAIAGQSGFNSTNRFYVTFRNLEGMSPQEYRSQFTD